MTVGRRAGSAGQGAAPGDGWLARDGAALGFAALALVVRLLPFRSVFLEGPGGGVHFTDSDAYYHARRILFDLDAFPGTLGFDTYLNFPEGAKAIWPQTFDWLIAAALWPFGLVGDATAVERVIVFVPPMLGAATVYLLHRLACDLFDRPVANLAAFVLALLPAHYWYSQLGFVDHHAAVAFCSTLAFFLALRLLRRLGEGSVGLLSLATFGFVLALNLSIWPGAILHVTLAISALLATGVFAEESAVRHRALGAVTAACGVACIAVSPLAIGNEWPQWEPYSAVVLTNFQPWFFAVIALAGWCVREVDRRREGSATGTRLALAFGIGAAALIGSFAFIPELSTSVRDSSQWLGRSDAFQAMVGESVPLFTLHGRFTTAIATSRLSLFVYFFPLAALWLAWRARGEREQGEVWAVVAWALALFAMTLLQKRFFNSFSVFMALVMAPVLFALARRLIANASWQRPLAFALALACLVPSLAFYRGPLELDVDAASASNPRIEANRARRKLVDWLRDNTPPTRGYLDPEVSPEYGVLARWGEGHFITYGARRPAVLGNFGDDLGRDHFLLARSFFEAPPVRASEVLEALKVRYVVIAASNERRPMATRLFRSEGSRLARYRFVHEIEPVAGAEVASYKIFEFVPGATLEGRTEPRALVRAELGRTTRAGRSTLYEEVVQADAEGRFELRVSHPTHGHPGGVETESHYRVSSAGHELAVEVPAEAVHSGTNLELGDLTRATPPRS